jgi:phosphomannomutase
MTDFSKFFKAYDMRGTVPELTAEIYYWTGFGLVTQVLIPENLPTEVNVMLDCRYSSPEFYDVFCKGIVDAGGKPQPLGLGSSDMLYGSCQVTNTPGAIITASHNPKDDNGVKILKIGSTMLGMDEGLDKVQKFVVEKMKTESKIDFESKPKTADNIELRKQVIEFFVDKVKSIGDIANVDKILSSGNKKLRVAVDAGNGMGGLVMDLISKLYTNIEFVPLYWELDGNYPNHPADPQNFENLKTLQQTIIDQKLDFGFAFDGDADRVFFVDEYAQVINGDFLCAFFAKTLLEKQNQNPDPNYNSAVVYLQPGSRCVPEIIAETDGVAVPSMQGHTKIKAQMQKYKAIYGGEFSGHHYFADFGYLDSGVMAAVIMIKILTEQNKKVSEVFEKLNKSYFISDLVNLSIPDGDNFENWKARIKEGFLDAAISEFDGISVFYEDWKFSMRPSNTEPKVRFILETRIVNTVKEKLALVKSVVGV